MFLLGRRGRGPDSAGTALTLPWHGATQSKAAMLHTPLDGDVQGRDASRECPIEHRATPSPSIVLSSSTILCLHPTHLPWPSFAPCVRSRALVRSSSGPPTSVFVCSPLNDSAGQVTKRRRRARGRLSVHCFCSTITRLFFLFYLLESSTTIDIIREITGVLDVKSPSSLVLPIVTN